MADQVALDHRGEHVTDAIQACIGRHRDVRQRPLFLSDPQPVDQRAGIAGHAAPVAVGMYQIGGEIAVFDAAQGTQHHDIEAIGRARRTRTGQEGRHGKRGSGKPCKSSDPPHRLARATAAFSSRLAPGTDRDSSIASLTLWLMPSKQGVKIIAVGAMVATA